jgi:hypothetical protein
LPFVSIMCIDPVTVCTAPIKDIFIINSSTNNY